MLEPPDLEDQTIIETVQDHFAIGVADLVFLPIGNDSASWAYRVEASQGPPYFLKVRAGKSHPPGVTIPNYLRRHGIPHVMASVETVDGASYVRVGGYALILYRMVEGGAGGEVGMSREHWRELGTLVRRVHDVPETAELTRLVRRERFRPSRRDVVARLDDLISSVSPDDDAASELAAFFRSRREVIRDVLDRAGTLGRDLKHTRAQHVLCHADLHAWNVLIGADGGLWLVDWDEAVMAPRERDLMFVIGGIGPRALRPGNSEWFFEGYGEVTVDRRLLAYYRAAWAVQDLGACAEEALLSPALGEASRRAGVDGFKGLFDPGNIVELALTSDVPDP
jgi:spectinomycin phosphotransferase